MSTPSTPSARTPPAAAAARAQEAGLAAVGVMDHDSVAGAVEMRQAGTILGIATTAGVELRVSAAGTRAGGQEDQQPGFAGRVLHDDPRDTGAEHRRGERFLRPIQASREKRGPPHGGQAGRRAPPLRPAALDWERDVRRISRADEGGTITERHILYAVAQAILAKAGRGEPLLAFVAGHPWHRPPAASPGTWRNRPTSSCFSTCWGC